MTSYNLRNPAVKRLMREADELKYPTEEYFAQPLEDNLFEWHFTLQGPPGTDFDGGIYHGRITLPNDYPMKPPNIILLTPNGRFETNKKICLSISGHHPETWQPSWSIRTALLAIIGFLPTHSNGALGSLDYTPEERRDLALKSRKWVCSTCGYIKDTLKHKEEISLKENENTSLEENSEYIKESSSDKNIGNESVADCSENNVCFRKKAYNHDHDISDEHIDPKFNKNTECKPNIEILNSNESQTVNSKSFFSVFLIWAILIILFSLIIRRIFYE